MGPAVINLSVSEYYIIYFAHLGYRCHCQLGSELRVKGTSSTVGISLANSVGARRTTVPVALHIVV
jgi:hypothetical protein